MKPQPVKEESTLHTQGEWKTEYQGYPDNETHICVADKNGDWIADCGQEGDEEAEANARRIVEAVNNFDRLTEENKQLREALRKNL